MRQPKKWRMMAALLLRECHSLQEKHGPTGIYRETVTPLWPIEGARIQGKPRVNHFHPQDPTNHSSFCEALRSAVALRLVIAWRARAYLEE